MKKKLFNEVKNTANLKLHDIRMYIDEIDITTISPLSSISDFDNATKGLFFVYLYGVFENIIKTTVTVTIECINNSSIALSNCKKELLCMAFDGEYTSLYNVGNDKKWEKRWNISTRLRENLNIIINPNVFPTDGKNIKVKELESIFKSFGFIEDILPRGEIGGYINEMVKNRNHIAHGDELPHEVGRRYTITDIKKSFECIDEYCTYFIDICENYIENNKYIET
jgi:hypothetical protein